VADITEDGESRMLVVTRKRDEGASIVLSGEHEERKERQRGVGIVKRRVLEAGAEEDESRCVTVKRPFT
jgi:hypothetical protein